MGKSPIRTPMAGTKYSGPTPSIKSGNGTVPGPSGSGKIRGPAAKRP